MGLYNEILRSNAIVRKSHSDFFGDYEDLKEYNTIPTTSLIYDYQLKKLEEFQKIAIKDNKKVQDLNKYFQNYGKFNSENEFEKIVEQAKNNIYNNILPSIRISGALSQRKLTANKELYNKTLNSLKELESQLNILRTQTNSPISGTYINQLSGLFNEVPGESVQQIMKNFFLLQGEILEELGTAWFNERIPKDLNVKMYSTGQVNISGKGQYISDMLIFDMDRVDLNQDILIEFKIGKNGDKRTLPLKEFLNLIESYTGQAQIIVEGTQFDQVMDAVLMGIQAKSGQYQKPWNVGSKNTWVSITEFEVEPSLYVFNRLNELRNSWDRENKQLKLVSPAYQAYADYGLATTLNKILHLSQLDNQYLLTPEGFITYSERLLQLYKGEKYMFTMKDVKLNDNIFNKKPVDLVKG